jgi:hypothetical protein
MKIIDILILCYLMIFFSAISFIFFIKGNESYTFTHLFIIRVALGPILLCLYMIFEKIISPDIRSTLLSIKVFCAYVIILFEGYIGTY